MNADNILRQINRRLKQVYDYFGERSEEYNDFKNVIYMNKDVLDFSSITKEVEGKPVQFSRSKKVLNAFIHDEGILSEQLEGIWDFMKNMGTVKQIVENRYYDTIAPRLPEGELPNWKTHHELIQDESRRRHSGKYYDRDLYAEIGDELSAAEQLMANDEFFDEEYFNQLNEAWQHFKDSGKGIRTEKYDRIGDAFEEAKKRHEERMNARSFTQSILNPSSTPNNPYDMGAN